MPRWLAVWGIAAMIPVTVGTLCTVLGINTSFALFVPYIPFEVFLGIWILIFGIRDETIRATGSEPAVVPLTHV